MFQIDLLPFASSKTLSTNLVAIALEVSDASDCSTIVSKSLVALFLETAHTRLSEYAQKYAVDYVTQGFSPSLDAAARMRVLIEATCLENVILGSRMTPRYLAEFAWATGESSMSTTGGVLRLSV